MGSISSKPEIEGDVNFILFRWLRNMPAFL